MNAKHCHYMYNYYLILLYMRSIVIMRNIIITNTIIFTGVVLLYFSLYARNLFSKNVYLLSMIDANGFK